MAQTNYADAVAEALYRLEGVGYEHGRSFANHAPMAAEAMAHLGFTDDVPAWLDRNLRRRRYHDAPQDRWRLSPHDEDDWRSALGDFGRVGDWETMFERELADRAWPQVLADWWPRLLPGMSGALTHGVIRTAHAVRALANAGVDDHPQRTELAKGLGYWAARYAGSRPQSHPENDDPARAPERAGGTELEAASVERALDELVLDGAEFYLRGRPSFPVPLIHTITAPAAIRLVCEYIPVGQRMPSYLTARRCSTSIREYFGSGSAAAPMDDEREPAAPADVVAAAVELGDEHAIKLAEVAVRLDADRPNGRVLAASRMATRLIRRNPV